MIFLAVVGTVAYAMTEADDAEMEGIQGQAGSLFVADKIDPNSLSGANSATNFTYYRMGLDARIDTNLNIDKMQLGCGGVNDLLVATPACDIDMDYLGFMGLNAAGTGPATNGPDSKFTLVRPFLEIAVKNDGTSSQREVVGFRIGAQNINGALRIGRDYTGANLMGQEASLANKETGATCAPSATTGSGVVGCHSGINSISGFLAGLEISAAIPINVKYCPTALCLFGPASIDADACLGDTYLRNCNGGTPLELDVTGTRMNQLYVRALPLGINLGFLQVTGYGSLKLDMKMVHYLLAQNSGGFSLSFQREPVAWPNYSKTATPYTPGSGYQAKANSGWWIAAEGLKLLDISPSNRVNICNTSRGDCGYTSGDLLGAVFNESSNAIVVDNPKLDLVAQRNCYGSQVFC